MYILIFIFISCSIYAFFGIASPKKNNIFTIGFYGNNSLIHPIKMGMGISTSLTSVVFDTLLDQQPDGKLIPRLATNWSVLNNGCLWKITIPSNIRFHNNQLLISADIAHTFNQIKNSPQHPLKDALAYVKQIKTPFPNKIEFHLTKPDHLFHIALTTIGIAQKNDTMEYHSIGTGSFQVHSQTNKQIALTAYPHYFQKQPSIQKIMINMFDSQRANLSAIAAGKVDMLILNSPNDYGILSALEHIQLYQLHAPFELLITLNHTHPLFQNKHIRQALNYAINRNDMIKNIFGKHSNTATPMLSFQHNGMPQYRYAPQKAAQLLQQAGWKDRNHDFILDKNGKKLEFTILITKERDLDMHIARMVQQSLSKLGIRMHIKSLNANQLWQQAYSKKQFDAMLILYHMRYPLFNHYLLWHSSQIKKGYNFSFFSSPQIDTLLDNARFSSTAHAQQNLNILENALDDHAPAIMLFRRYISIAIDKRIKGIPPKPYEFFKIFHELYVE